MNARTLPGRAGSGVVPDVRWDLFRR